MSKSYTLEAPGIKATILSHGAVLQSLLVKDKDGQMRDVVVGFDDPADYVNSRTFDGTVIGRYANRIKAGTFSIDGETYHVPLNEAGKSALHGGDKGYDRFEWNVVSQGKSTITLSHLDKAGSEGFPGAVQNHITYTVSSEPARLTVRIVSLSLDQRTPIMPTTHTFWNLSGFKTPTILDDTLHLPHASKVIAVDGLLNPTGEISTLKGNKELDFLDFTTARRVSENAPADRWNNSGEGIDHAYVFEQEQGQGQGSTKPRVELQWSSPASGIRMTLKTNQHGLQIYTAKHHDGTRSVKDSQKGGASEQIQRFGCMAIEPQDWIDGINHPEWERMDRQVYGPEDGPNVNWAEYAFDTV